MNEVKRALMFWPAFISTLLILISLMTPGNNGSWDEMASRARTNWQKITGAGSEPLLAETKSIAPIDSTGVKRAPKALHDVMALPSDIKSAASADRAERGSRALRLPDRVAQAFGGSHSVSSMSNQDLVIQPPRNIDTSVDSLSMNLMSGDILAAERIANKETIAADQAIGAEMLQRVPFEFNKVVRRETRVQVVEEEQPSIELTLPTAEATTDLSLVDPGPVMETIPEPLDQQPSLMPRSITNLAKVVPRHEQEQEADQVQSSTSIDVKAAEAATQQAVKRTLQGNPAAWPLTNKLNDRLQSLASTVRSDSGQLASSRSEATVAQWTKEVQECLAELRSLPRLGDRQAASLIKKLEELSSTGYQKAEGVTDRQQQVEWLLATHAIARRVAVWKPIYKIASDSNGWVSDGAPTTSIDHVKHLVATVRSDLAETGDSAGWGSYLLLDEIIDAAEPSQIEKRTHIAQRFMSRIQWHGLDQASLAWLGRSSVAELKKAIKPWARNAVDYASLLNQIERQEADAIDLAAIDIAGAAQTLRFAENPAATEIATAIDTYYRNANIRTAISEELIQRMIPAIDPQTVPVRTTMLGSRVRGISHIHSDLKLKLTPSPDRWMFMLHAAGNVQTHSVGLKGNTSLSTRGNSNFVAATPVEITPYGVTYGRSNIDVVGRTRLRDVRTPYDQWPLFGSLVRGIATSKYQEVSGLSSRIANRRIEHQVGSEIDQRLNKRVAAASSTLGDMVMGPLSELKLSPKVVDMKTTDKRLVARYRLAGDWQIGSFTPRPRAPSDSLISLQINQSALNNTLEQVVPSDAPTTIQSAVNKTLASFGRDAKAMPEDIPQDVRIQFAKTRPITIEIKEGLLWVTMRIVELSREKGPKLRRFIVRAAYKPEIDGLRASLVRDGHLRISGPGMSMRERLPVRAIFNKVLSPNRSVSLTLPKLVTHPSMQNARISQLELRDGWLALAISDHRVGTPGTIPSDSPGAGDDRVAERNVESHAK